MADIAESIGIYQELNLDLQVEISMTTEGSFRWHMGNYNVGLERNKQFIENHQNVDEIIRAGNSAVACCNNATVYSILGEWKEARRYFDLALQISIRLQFESIQAMMRTLGGLILARTGDVLGGAEMLIEGLQLSYRRGQPREQQIGLEWACGVLAYQGYEEDATAVLDWVNGWRESTLHTRSVAEATYAGKIYALSGGRSILGIDPKEPTRAVMAFVIQRLRAIQAKNR
jgi:tetratricopeptide (TPR) repeat protein